MNPALAAFALSLFATVALAERPVFQPADLFQMQWASDPRISPDGRRIVYVRNHADIMADRYRQNLWIVDIDGRRHEALTTGGENHSQPRWSPDGTRVAVEPQSYAAAGYVVLYTNPRRSTGYGREFAQLIHHNTSRR